MSEETNSSELNVDLGVMTINGVQQPANLKLEKQFPTEQAVEISQSNLSQQPVGSPKPSVEIEDEAESGGDDSDKQHPPQRPTHEQTEAEAYKVYIANSTDGIPPSPEQTKNNWYDAEENLWHTYIDAKYHKHHRK